ncbi:MAG: DUF502 domain-containing protein [Chitinophagales bacterium]
MNKHKLRNFLATTFLGGVVVILPLAIFGLLANWIIGIIGGFLDPVVSLFPESWNVTLVKLIAFAIITVLCFLIGLSVRTQIGTAIFSLFEENTIGRLPFYSVIKETVQQFIGKEKTPFSRVVLVEPFAKGAKMIGFVTDENEEEGTYTVFAPTAPNPTNGYVFILTKEQIEFLDVKSEQAMKSIVSLGAGTAGMAKVGKATS